MKLLVAGLLAVMALSLGLLLAGYYTAGVLVSVGGTLAVEMGVLLWVVAVDSRRRWPGTAWKYRLTRVMSIGRWK